MDRSRRLAASTAAAGLALWITAGSVMAADQSVTIAGFAFSPGTVTLRVGDSVTWTNQDSVAHTATASGRFDTGNIADGASSSIKFRTAGSFDYICAIHPTMEGTVVVRSASGGAGATPAPTDTAPLTSVDPDNEGRLLTATLAVLGLVMLTATFAADRRFRRRAT